MRETVSSSKIMKKVLGILRERSIKSIKLAQAEMLSINVESKKAHEALEYYVKNLNDFIHPGVISLTCEAVGGEPKDAVPMQVVTLLLTAAMDVHDDIIDETEVKNHKSTIYGKFGKDIALLIGDAFFLRGFTFLGRCRDIFSQEQFKAIIYVINDSFVDVGNAHLLEVTFKRKLSLAPSTYLQVLERKASIIEGLAKIGAIVGKGSTFEIGSLGKYGKLLGTLIALREEFIDIFEIDELLNRMKSGCLPLPILYAHENLKIKRMLLTFDSASQNFDREAVIERLVDLVFKDANVKKLKRLMQHLSSQALSIINQLKLSSSIANQLRILISGTLEDL